MKLSSGQHVSFSMAPVERWQEYERRKREFVLKNGRVSDAEYRAALDKICRDLGL